MKPEQKEVIEERSLLEEKIYRLNRFFQTNDFLIMNPIDVGLLREQLDIMKEYSNVLKRRIKNFKY